MASIVITGTQEQLLRLARILTEAAQESKDRSVTSVTIDNVVTGASATVTTSGGSTRK